MRSSTFLISAAGALCLSVAMPSFAQTAADPSNVKAEDVLTSPLSDVNLKRRDVPPVLTAALERPYDLTGVVGCRGLSAAVTDLDAVLGDDIDVVQAKTDDEKMGNSAGAVAKTLIGSFIPFRGLVRELSGANSQERAWQRALYAGSVRRAFLKGIGEQRKCAYPARSATPQVVALLSAQRDAANLAKKSKSSDEKTAGAPTEVSN